MAGLSVAGGQTGFREAVRRTLRRTLHEHRYKCRNKQGLSGSLDPQHQVSAWGQGPPWPGTPGEELICQKRESQASHSTALEELSLLLQTALNLFSPPSSWQVSGDSGLSSEASPGILTHLLLSLPQRTSCWKSCPPWWQRANQRSAQDRSTASLGGDSPIAATALKMSLSGV